LKAPHLTVGGFRIQRLCYEPYFWEDVHESPGNLGQQTR
jgi:hypothetical protein